MNTAGQKCSVKIFNADKVSIICHTSGYKSLNFGSKERSSEKKEALNQNTFLLESIKF